MLGGDATQRLEVAELESKVDSFQFFLFHAGTLIENGGRFMTCLDYCYGSFKGL